MYMQRNLLKDDLTLIHKSWEWGHTDLIFKQEVKYDYTCLNVEFGDGSCNNRNGIWISKCMPLISQENIYYCSVTLKGQTHLVDVFWLVLQTCSYTHDENLPNPKLTVCALTPDISKWGLRDLIFGMLCSTHLTWLQFWYKTPGPNGLKTPNAYSCEIPSIPMKMSTPAVTLTKVTHLTEACWVVLQQVYLHSW